MVFKNMNTMTQILEDTVHISKFYLPEHDKLLIELEKLLSIEEKTKATNYKFEQHKKRFIITRGFLRKVLAFYLQCNAADIEILTTNKGKPFIDNSTIEFNVSHSGDYSVIAVTKNKPIGVDIEKAKDTFNENIAKRIFSKEENQYLMSLPEEKRANAFFTIWAKKEAYIKLHGKSIFNKSVEFSVISNKINNIIIKEISVHPKYKSAISISLPLRAIEYWGFDDGLYKKLSAGEM